MVYDERKAAIFKEIFDESYRTALNLVASVRRSANIFPLTGKRMEVLSEEEKEKIDAFRVRFADLQDSLGTKLFKSLLRLEEENIGSMLDSLNQMEKRRIISSFEEWKKLREIRNLFSHEYPQDAEDRAETLNLAYEASNKLVEILKRVKEYVVDSLDLNMDEFSDFK